MKIPIIEKVSTSFLDAIIRGMASGWYYNGLHDRISLWNHEGDFEAIKDYFSGMVVPMWDETSYSVDILAPEHPTSHELHIIKRDMSLNTLPQFQNPNNKNVDICQRYIDAGIISLISLGCIEKDFSWTLN